jgi:hypothetical protein
MAKDYVLKVKRQTPAPPALPALPAPSALPALPALRGLPALRAARALRGILALVLLLVGGCASNPPGNWVGPQTLAPVKTAPWRDAHYSGTVITTPHYQIYTTAAEHAVIQRLAQVLEGAFGQYQRFAPTPPSPAPAPAPAPAPLKCYVFADRRQYLQFTRALTGPQAGVYVQVTRGGYTFGDVFVALFTGEDSIYSIASHEGWHQYVSRRFKGRLPPFLEEGTACMFENVRYRGKLPRWELSINPSRALGLRNAIDGHDLWPLDKLITMHAGDIVRLPYDRIQSFYAQNWAFARFLWDANGAAYRPAFRRLLTDTANGDPFDPSHTLRSASGIWAPRTIKPVLEHYLGKSLEAIDKDYQAFIRIIAYDEFGRQWGGG